MSIVVSVVPVLDTNFMRTNEHHKILRFAPECTQSKRIQRGISDRGGRTLTHDAFPLKLINISATTLLNSKFRFKMRSFHFISWMCCSVRIAVCEMRWLGQKFMGGRPIAMWKLRHIARTRELSHSNHWIRNRQKRLSLFQRHRWEFSSLSIFKRCWKIYLMPVILLWISLLITRWSNQLQFTELIWWKAKCIRFVQIESVLLPKFGNCWIPHERILLRANSLAFAYRFILNVSAASAMILHTVL